MYIKLLLFNPGWIKSRGVDGFGADGSDVHRRDPSCGRRDDRRRGRLGGHRHCQRNRTI